VTDFSLVNPDHFDLSAVGNGARSSPVLIEAHFSSFDHPLDGDLASRPPQSEVLATMSEVKRVSENRPGVNARLVDVRRPGEYDGVETRYYPFFSKAGHIPRAVLQGNWINLVESDTRKVGPALESVRQRWIEQGIVDAGVESGETSLIFYRGTGWRSSLSFLVATLLGYRARNFDHGFYGWSWTGENEVEYRSPEAVGAEPSSD